MIQKLETMVRSTAESHPLYKFPGILYVSLKNSFNEVRSDQTYSEFIIIDRNITVQIKTIDLLNKVAVVLIKGKEEKQIIIIQKGGQNV